MKRPSEIAAIDLGSNSFHLLIARPQRDGFTEVERLKDKVQLLHGLRDQQLHPQAMQRGRACLERFRQRLRALSAERVVIMGTQALREASNGAAFAEDLSGIVGVPVQVISGAEEAQLIYSAVFHRTAWMPQHKIVLDIGGGSTEIAMGAAPDSAHQLSVGIGCVSLMDRFFTKPGKFSEQLSSATEFAEAPLEQALRAQPRLAAGLPALLDAGALSFGTSGTVESVLTVLQANGWIDQDITPDALSQLNDALMEDRWVIDAGLPGLPPDRADIFPAGVAILSACFKVLQLPALRFVGVSLLHGMLYAKLQGEAVSAVRDVRESSVKRLASEYAIDQAQAARVTETAMSLYTQSASWWQGGGEYADLLRWSAGLHEVGRQINSSHYHRHGGYIVKHAQLPGFSDQQRNMLALLIRGHRRSMPEIAFRAFSPEHQRGLLRAVTLLRLAVILERSHTPQDSPRVTLQVSDDDMQLNCGANWLDEHPLSARELDVEIEQLRRCGIRLRVC